MRPFIVAAAQFPVFEPASFAEYEETMAHWVHQARGDGAELLVFPEYAGLILASILPLDVRQNLREQVHALQDEREHYMRVHRRLAQEHGVYILAGSMPWRLPSGDFVNRAWLFAPSGTAGFQDKRMMTRFEREDWDITAGEGLRVFQTALGRIGVGICYDSEFPLLARAQAEAGATLLVVPSCTDTRAGYERVRLGCRARALENQFYVAQAPLVGELPWSPAIDVNVGRAGIFGPPDHGFPEDGVLAEGAEDSAGWAYATLDPALVEQVRREGQVRPFAHWPEQDGAATLPQVELVVM